MPHTSLTRILMSLLCLSLLTRPVLARYDIAPAETKVNLPQSTEVLKEISRGVEAIAANGSKALVYIAISKMMKEMVDPLDFFGLGPRGAPRSGPAPKQEGLGSGFIIDLDKGYVITNNHVVEGADEIHLKLANGKIYMGKVIASDPNTDVGVVKVADEKFDRSGLGALILGDSDNIRMGSFAVALGAPFGLETSVSFGVVSAIGRGSLSIAQMGNFLQTDAAINAGNSGGPLIDTDGKVIGMNTAIYSRTGGSNGIGFAVPSNLVREIATSLINEGGITRGYIGVAFQALPDEWIANLKLPKETKGAIVSDVVKDGPADKAGLDQLDVIVALNGKAIDKSSDLANTIGLSKPGTKIDVDYYRNGKKSKTSITVGKWPGSEKVAAGSKKNNFGLSLSPVNGELRGRYGVRSETGLVVTKVDPNSVAARSELIEGDVIIRVNNDLVRSVSDFNKAMKESGSTVLLLIERKSQVIFIPFQND